MTDEFQERRQNSGLTDEQVEAVKEAILKSIYADIGRSLVRKVLWVGGAAIFALYAYLVSTGKAPKP